MLNHNVYTPCFEPRVTLEPWGQGLAQALQDHEMLRGKARQTHSHGELGSTQNAFSRVCCVNK